MTSRLGLFTDVTDLLCDVLSISRQAGSRAEDARGLFPGISSVKRRTDSANGEERSN